MSSLVGPLLLRSLTTEMTAHFPCPRRPSTNVLISFLATIVNGCARCANDSTPLLSVEELVNWYLVSLPFSHPVNGVISIAVHCCSFKLSCQGAQCTGVTIM